MSSPDYGVTYSIRNCLFQSKLRPIEDMTRFSSFALLYKNTSTAFKQILVHQKEQIALYSQTRNKTIFILKVFWIKGIILLNCSLCFEEQLSEEGTILLTSSFWSGEEGTVKGSFSSDEFSSFREHGTQKGTFSVKSSLCFRELGTKWTFLVKSSLHSREQMSEMMSTSFKRTKKGTHVQFNAYIEQKWTNLSWFRLHFKIWLFTSLCTRCLW